MEPETTPKTPESPVAGAKNGRAKLTNDQVLIILVEHYLGKKSNRELARRFNVSDRQIRRIVRGECW